MIQLTHAEFHVDRQAREVRTVFPDGAVALATRAPDRITLQDAADLGYTDSADGVWRSLVEHELLHNLVSEWAWQRPSRVLRFCATGEPWVPYLERLHEEAVVLSYQLFLRTGDVAPSLRLLPSDSRYWRANAERWIREAMGGAE